MTGERTNNSLVFYVLVSYVSINCFRFTGIISAYCTPTRPFSVVEFNLNCQWNLCLFKKENGSDELPFFEVLMIRLTNRCAFFRA